MCIEEELPLPYLYVSVWRCSLFYYTYIFYISLSIAMLLYTYLCIEPVNTSATRLPIPPLSLSFIHAATLFVTIVCLPGSYGYFIVVISMALFLVPTVYI